MTWRALYILTTYTSYNALDAADFKHFRINHSKGFAIKSNLIEPSENFWSQAKRTVRKFNGIPRKNFYLILRECEWGFNNPSAKIQLKLLIKPARKKLF